MSLSQQRRLYDSLVLNVTVSSQRLWKQPTGIKAKAAVLTLLSPPDTARILAVMDQLTCQTTSLNLCSSFGDQEFPEASSHVQINTLPSCNSTETNLAGHKKHNPDLPLELHFQITAQSPPLDVSARICAQHSKGAVSLLCIKVRQENSSDKKNYQQTITWKKQKRAPKIHIYLSAKILS